MKLYILGLGAKNRSKENPQSSGKDYCAEYLRDKIGCTFESSSQFACKHFIFDLFKEEKGYKTWEECYSDRHSDGMRKRWYDEICKLNSKDLTFLSTAIFEIHDIYVGLRNESELRAAQAKWDDLVTVWIDASKRVESESKDSCTVTPDMCDLIITNNGTLEQYDYKLSRLAMLLGDKDG